MDQYTPVILSNWYEYLVSVILTGIVGALAYLFHNRVSPREMDGLRDSIKDLKSDLRADISEIRGILLERHASDRSSDSIN